MTTNKKKAENFYTNAVSVHLLHLRRLPIADSAFRTSRTVIVIAKSPSRKLAVRRTTSRGKRCAASDARFCVPLVCYLWCIIIVRDLVCTLHPCMLFVFVQ